MDIIYPCAVLACLFLAFFVNYKWKTNSRFKNLYLFSIALVSLILSAVFIYIDRHPKIRLTATEEMIKSSFTWKMKEEILSSQRNAPGKIKTVVIICYDLVGRNNKIQALKESLKDHKEIEFYSLELDYMPESYDGNNRKICALINSKSTKKEFCTLIFYDGMDGRQDFDGVDDQLDLSLIKIISQSRPEDNVSFKKISSINYLYFNSDNKDKKIDNKTSMDAAAQIFWISKEIESIH